LLVLPSTIALAGHSPGAGRSQRRRRSVSSWRPVGLCWATAAMSDPARRGRSTPPRGHAPSASTR